jgi:hypothetical protein
MLDSGMNISWMAERTSLSQVELRQLGTGREALLGVGTGEI